MVLNDLVRRNYIGESYFVRQNPEHKWYYLSDQTRDEVAVLKIFDSDEKVDAKCKLALFLMDRCHPYDRIRTDYLPQSACIQALKILDKWMKEKAWK